MGLKERFTGALAGLGLLAGVEQGTAAKTKPKEPLEKAGDRKEQELPPRESGIEKAARGDIFDPVEHMEKEAKAAGLARAERREDAAQESAEAAEEVRKDITGMKPKEDNGS